MIVKHVGTSNFINETEGSEAWNTNAQQEVQAPISGASASVVEQNKTGSLLKR